MKRLAKQPGNVGHRIVREKDIVAIMIYKYCKGHGHIRNENTENGSDGMCTDCKDLVRYAHTRLELCRFGEGKTTCGRCPVHCYKADRRFQIKAVMKYAGPRMLWSHPLESLRHALDGWSGSRKKRV
ncbi:nitrous oxide-stimulated promoter family protein [Paenibacillus sp. FA6]|uniref:nitrous oxide-stimulated promoter family protein n=1 Tax=Paenibacillus sp. FA6 TaxID=3413029 RepID=UPI003F65AA0E